MIFIVSFGRVQKGSNTYSSTRVRVWCVGLENQKRPHDDQKWRCSAAERKTVMRDEYRKLCSDPRPRACVVSMEELPEVLGWGKDFQRTFRTSSADPVDERSEF